MGLTVLGALTHAGVLVARGLATDRLPWGNMYEFATATVLVAVVAYVVLALRVARAAAPRPVRARPGRAGPGADRALPLRRGGAAGGGAAVVLAGDPREHRRSSASGSSSSAGSPASCTCSGSATTSGPTARRPDSGLLSRLPGPRALDRVAHRTAVFGFPIWTFAVIAGAIWAEAAWGRFWGWDPKETWAFIAWVVYAAYLHARTTAGWRGRPPPGSTSSASS